MKQHILILTPAIGRRGGGVSEAARLFTKAMVSDGRFEPEVVTLVDDTFDKDKAAWPDVKIRAFRSYGPSNYGFSPGMLFYVLRSRASAVHVHGIWSFHVFCAALWSSLKRKPAIITPHGMLEPWILLRSRRLKAAVSKLYQDRFLRRATLHVLTEKEKTDVENAGIPTERCHVIPNYVVSPPKESQKPTWWQEEFEGRRVYLFFGRIHDKKGWKELCQAWETLNTDDQEFCNRAQLVFCGWVDDCPDFEATVERLGKRYGNACFAGPQFGVDRDRSYSVADFFLLPSKSEGLPMSILEAWAAGVPTVMTRACNLNLGFDAGAAIETGEDASTIALTLREVQDWSAETLTTARKKSRSLATDAFSQDAVSFRINNLFLEAINDGRETVEHD